jgi:autotransporter-associated beta strand protein
LRATANALFGWDGTQDKPITVYSGSTLTSDSGADIGVGTVTIAGGTLASLGASATWGSWRFDNPGDKLVVTEDSVASAVNVKFQNGGAIDVAAGKTLDFTGTITDSSSGGVSTLVKSGGSGTLTLANANTFTGGTTLSAGTLLVNGSLASGVSVSSGATLGGNGTVNGSVSVSGTIAPGTSIGTLTFGSAPTLASGSAIVAEVNQTNGQTADKIIVSSGTLSFGGTLTITNVGPVATNGTFTLFSGALSGSFAATNFPPGGANHWKTDQLNVNGTVTYTNSNPVVSALTMGARSGVATSLKIIGGKRAPTDAENDTLTITSVGTPANGTNSTDGVNVTYTPSSTFNGTDSFTYTVSDGFGGSATATVTVTVGVNGESGNRLSAVSLGNGTNVLTFLGIPGTNYCLELATNLTAPVYWHSQQTNTAPANGLLIYTNVSTWLETYYRTKYVP